MEILIIFDMHCFQLSYSSKIYIIYVALLSKNGFVWTKCSSNCHTTLTVTRGTMQWRWVGIWKIVRWVKDVMEVREKKRGNFEANGREVWSYSQRRRVRVAFICGLMMIHGYSRIITLLNFWTLFLACSREEKAGMRLRGYRWRTKCKGRGTEISLE